MRLWPMLLAFAAVSSAQTAPVTQYDKVRDLTGYSSGIVKFRNVSSFWCEAVYGCRGHDNYRPDKVVVVFSASRIPPNGDPAQDADVAVWSSVKEVALRFNDDSHTYSATYSRATNNDELARILVGRTFFEQVAIQMPVDEFVQMAESDDVQLAVGDHEDEMKGKQLSAFKRLAQSIPAGDEQPLNPHLPPATPPTPSPTPSDTDTPTEDPAIGHERYLSSTSPKYLDGVILIETKDLVVVDGSAKDSHFNGREVILSVSVDSTYSGLAEVKSIAALKTLLAGKKGSKVLVRSRYGHATVTASIDVKFTGE